MSRFLPLALGVLTLVLSASLVWAGAAAGLPAAVAFVAEGVVVGLMAVPLTVHGWRTLRDDAYAADAAGLIVAMLVELARAVADRPDAHGVRLLLDACGADLESADGDRRRVLADMLLERLRAVGSASALTDTFAAFAHMMEAHPREAETIAADMRAALAAVWDGADPYGREWHCGRWRLSFLGA